MNSVGTTNESALKVDAKDLSKEHNEQAHPIVPKDWNFLLLSLISRRFPGKVFAVRWTKEFEIDMRSASSLAINFNWIEVDDMENATQDEKRSTLAWLLRLRELLLCLFDRSFIYGNLVQWNSFQLESSTFKTVFVWLLSKQISTSSQTTQGSSQKNFHFFENWIFTSIILTQNSTRSKRWTETRKEREVKCTAVEVEKQRTWVIVVRF